ncbi:MAG: hypothetical protein B6244_00610 [Candidatus Cloacimonetes bacterium 4572_55]|nr:MAG: hypothetical protein B6244_00610 [Candidatus Cloacimonetes bacterium 4572_55]
MPRTILIAEDSSSILITITKMLEFEGFHVLSAQNGRIALEILETRVPDLIITDIMMPYVDGYQLYEKVHKNPRLAGVPFIFLTAKATRKDIRIGKEMGVDDYFVKPFNSKDLLTLKTRDTAFLRLTCHLFSINFINAIRN